jgi:hypothetical protein
VAARSEVRKCGMSLAGIAGSNTAVGMDVLLSCLCVVEVPATGQSLVQSSPTERGVSECDCEAAIISRPWPTTVCGDVKIYEACCYVIFSSSFRFFPFLVLIDFNRFKNVKILGTFTPFSLLTKKMQGLRFGRGGSELRKLCPVISIYKSFSPVLFSTSVYF